MEVKNYRIDYNSELFNSFSGAIPTKKIHLSKLDGYLLIKFYNSYQTKERTYVIPMSNWLIHLVLTFDIYSTFNAKLSETYNR